MKREGAGSQWGELWVGGEEENVRAGLCFISREGEENGDKSPAQKPQNAPKLQKLQKMQKKLGTQEGRDRTERVGILSARVVPPTHLQLGV